MPWKQMLQEYGEHISSVMDIFLIKVKVMLGMIRKDAGLVQERTKSKYLATTLGNALLWGYATHISVFVLLTTTFTFTSKLKYGDSNLP